MCSREVDRDTGGLDHINTTNKYNHDQQLSTIIYQDAGSDVPSGSGVPLFKKSNCQTLDLSLFIFHYILYKFAGSKFWGLSCYTKKNTLIQHARESRVRHNVFSTGNRHNSLKIQRNCPLKYMLDPSKCLGTNFP
jgi:hypothetical protein